MSLSPRDFHPGTTSLIAPPLAKVGGEIAGIPAKEQAALATGRAKQAEPPANVARAFAVRFVVISVAMQTDMITLRPVLRHETITRMRPIPLLQFVTADFGPDEERRTR